MVKSSVVSRSSFISNSLQEIEAGECRHTKQRTIAGVSKTIGYAYQLGGSLKSLTYPSGRVVNYTVDSASRLLTALDGNGTQYVTNATYWPNGAEFQQWMPHIYFRTDLNNRLQIAGLYSDNGVTASYYMYKTYNYGAQNNGNVMSIVNNKDTSRTETFTYDALNRITAGWTTADTGALSWGENYELDAWGNLMTSPMAGKAAGGNFQCAGDPLNRATCLSYDAAGNVTANAPAAYTYDQENRIASTAGMTYVYDANGNRIEKTGGGSGTLYWYGSPGILAESDLAGNLKSEYVFFGGKRVARIDSPGNSVHYYLSDHLNSTSMVVSSTGIPEEESDYSPFGTEYVVTSSGANHYKFTGKERDAESQLDYFGARYYSNGLGRFITPDWAPKAAAVPFADFSDPQSLNLYSLVRNEPLAKRDVDGHNWKEAWKHLKNAARELTERVTIGIGIGGKGKIGPVNGKLEAAVKANVKHHKGKISVSESVDIGATVGVGKTKVGIGLSAEQVKLTVDTNTGEVSGPKPATGETTIGISHGDASGSGNQEKVSIGGEGGEGAIGGGAVSLSEQGLNELEAAADEALNSIFDAVKPNLPSLGPDDKF